MLPKRKVSFDIDQKLLNEIKNLCDVKKIKLSDFFRDASRTKLDADVIYLSIYVPYGGKIEHFQINRNDYEIDLFEASQQMKVNVGAECEGILREYSTQAIQIFKKEKEFDKLEEIIKNSPEKKVAFYTTKKYC